MSIQSTIQQNAFRTQQQLRGESMTFTRPVDDEELDDISIEISLAVRGSSPWTVDQPFEGASIGARSVDWIVAASDLTDDDGTQYTPKRDDTFTDANGVVYRVLPFADGAPLWRWHDRDGRTIRRVFTKEQG